MAKEKKDGMQLVIQNRRARFNYELLEKFEAGLVLQGSEVKSIRDGRVSIQEAFARAEDGEFFVYQMDVAPYNFAGPLAHEPKRPKKLLLKKHEIQKLLGKTRERGLTLVPTSLYFTRGRAKLEIALARSRKKGDKREVIKKREVSRELRRAAGRRR